MPDGERYDRYRYLEEWIESWIYYIDEPDVKVQPTTNHFWYEGDYPFNNTRDEWIKQIHDTEIIPRLTQAMIDEFGKRGICAAANEDQCSPSINWNFQIISAVFEYTSGCPERQINFYKDLQKSIDEENKKFDDREKEIDRINKIKEKTIDLIDRREDLIDANERSKKKIDDYRKQIDRIKETCPDIENLI